MRRQGWIGKVSNADVESIADHSYGVVLLALFLVPIENKLRDEGDALNKLSVLEKSVLHDLGEGLYFDMDKSLLNLVGLREAKEIKNKLDSSSEKIINDEYIELGLKFNITKLKDLNFYNIDNQESEEDLFVKFLDIFDLYLQTNFYLKNGFISKSNAQPFLDSSLSFIKGLERNFKIINNLLEMINLD